MAVTFLSRKRQTIGRCRELREGYARIVTAIDTFAGLRYSEKHVEDIGGKSCQSCRAPAYVLGWRNVTLQFIFRIHPPTAFCMAEKCRARLSNFVLDGMVLTDWPK